LGFAAPARQRTRRGRLARPLLQENQPRRRNETALHYEKILSPWNFKSIAGMARLASDVIEIRKHIPLPVSFPGEIFLSPFKPGL